MNQLEAWCREHDIDLGLRLTHSELRFDADLLAEINDILESGRLAEIGESLSGLTSIAQARKGKQEDKNVGEGPRTHRVLLNLPCPLAKRPEGERRIIRDVDWRSLSLSDVDALVQVENLESFYAFNPNILDLNAYANPLIAYRGDSYYGGGFAKLADIWRKTHRPYLYLGDFDAKGVTLALDNGATHLLLPDIEWLIQHATPLHQPAGQLAYQRRLRQLHVSLTPEHPLRPYLALLEQQRGLLQQWFEGEEVCVGLV